MGVHASREGRLAQFHVKKGRTAQTYAKLNKTSAQNVFGAELCGKAHWKFRTSYQIKIYRVYDYMCLYIYIYIVGEPPISRGSFPSQT